MTINVIVLLTSFAAGILVDYLINSPASATKRATNAMQWLGVSTMFGLVTPTEATNIALFYLITPAASRLLGHVVYRPAERLIARAIGQMYLNGHRRIMPLGVVWYVCRGLFTTRSTRKKKRNPRELEKGGTLDN